MGGYYSAIVSERFLSKLVGAIGNDPGMNRKGIPLKETGMLYRGHSSIPEGTRFPMVVKGPSNKGPAPHQPFLIPDQRKP